MPSGYALAFDLTALDEPDPTTPLPRLLRSAERACECLGARPATLDSLCRDARLGFIRFDRIAGHRRLWRRYFPVACLREAADRRPRPFDGKPPRQSIALGSGFIYRPAYNSTLSLGEVWPPARYMANPPLLSTVKPIQVRPGHEVIDSLLYLTSQLPAMIAELQDMLRRARNDTDRRATLRLLVKAQNQLERATYWKPAG